MDDRKARIQKLSERFKPRPDSHQTTTRERQRRSFYLDIEIAERIDKEHKDLNHRTYPQTVSKSVFLEAVLEYGMNNLNEVMSLIRERSAVASTGSSPKE
jgi:hypothetical protein